MLLQDLPPDRVWQIASPKVLKKVQSGPMWADKKKDPYPAKCGYRCKVFLLSPGKADTVEITKYYLI
jgi:hypothetical protein